MSDDNPLPEGFSPHFRQSPLTDPWEPLFSKITEKAVILALRAGEQHCNSRGFVHGGLITALADNAMGLSCAKHHDAIGGLLTVTLNLEFLAPAAIGNWLEFRTIEVKTGRRNDAAQAQIFADDKLCAFASATFSVAPAKS